MSTSNIHPDRMRIIETDVLVVGSGIAGVASALKAARMGCEVLLTSKVSMKSGNSVFAGGGWLLPSRDFSPEDYFRVVMEGGKQINNSGLIRVIAHKGETTLRGLEQMGIPLEKRSKRVWDVSMGTSSKYAGIVIMDRLLEHAKDQQITTLPWTLIIELLLEEGRLSGALGFSRKEGMVIISAKSVVLATGGAGAIYKRTDNHRRITGDGYCLALRVGLPLKDMEFVQFYPIALAEPPLPPIVIQGIIPEEARIIDSSGEDLIKKHGLRFNLRESLMEYRDQFTLILTRELERGAVYVDCRAVQEEKWNKYFLNILARLNPDFRYRPFSVAPVAHFFMGGIEIDQHARTEIPGIFAAGEVTSGVHGANREGGNALTEGLVFGEVAGESAAQYAMANSRGKLIWQTPRDRIAWKDHAQEEKNLLRKVQDLTWTHAGPIRDARSLQKGLLGVSEIEQRLEDLETMGRSIGLNEVRSGLLVSKAIMRASLERKESRGAFYREDFPERDDANWLKNIILRLDSTRNDFIVSHRPVGT